MYLTFLGATDTVTGSRFLVRSNTTEILVDCGLYQGLKIHRERNWARFDADLDNLSAIVLTHAHLDHSGYLPVLVKRGFRGKVYCTDGTADLLRILLPDAGYLAEEDARYRNKHGATRHDPALPLFTIEDAHDALELVEPVEFGQRLSIGSLTVSFRPAGHILGAASARVEEDGCSLVFSGDVGRSNDPVMRPAEPYVGSDWLVMESTYGDRAHLESDPSDALEAVVKRTIARGGTLLIPAFAVGRTQGVLHLLLELQEAGRIPQVPIWVNSPMATQATATYLAHGDEHRLTPDDCERMRNVVQYAESTEASRALTSDMRPKIVLSASGMATGGRVLHHLKRLLPDKKHTVALVGFQAPGTRGEALANGMDEVKIHGRYVPVRAEVVQIDNLSAHADYKELLAWVGGASRPPRETFLVHGRPSGQDALRRRFEDRGWEARIPSFRDTVELTC